MSQKELENRYNLLFQQLEVINRFRNAFVDKLGEQGTKAKIDQILDEIIYIRGELDKLKKED